MKRRTLSRSAQYGQACMSCVKAKYRCVARAEWDGCERLEPLHELPRARLTSIESTGDDFEV